MHYLLRTGSIADDAANILKYQLCVAIRMTDPIPSSGVPSFAQAYNQDFIDYINCK
jgi:hypothetical protein